MKIKDKYYKETEHLLYNYKVFEISIDNMEKEIEFLKKEKDIRYGEGITYDDIKTSPTFKITSSTENIALSISEKTDYLEHSIRRIRSKLEIIDKSMEGLSDIEREVINQKYINNKQWWEVAYLVKYSERHCKRIRTNAIKKMAIAINGDIAIEK